MLSERSRYRLRHTAQMLVSRSQRNRIMIHALEYILRVLFLDKIDGLEKVMKAMEKPLPYFNLHCKQLQDQFKFGDSSAPEHMVWELAKKDEMMQE
jgi:hypothetical protein